MVQQNRPFTQIETQLLEAGVLVNARVKKTLGAGAAMPGGRVLCWEINGNHEMVVELIESLPDNVVAMEKKVETHILHEQGLRERERFANKTS